MKDRKQVLMVMPVMKGGGAERVAALLMNEFYRNKYDVKFLLTSSNKDDVVNRELNVGIPLVLLQEHISYKRGIADYAMKVVKLYASFFCRIIEGLGRTVPNHFAYCSFVSQYNKEIQELRKILKENPDMTVIAFLQPSIPMILLAAKGLPNKVIISERGNPERLMKHRYGRKFIEKYYQRANVVVFQTDGAKNVYPYEIAKKGKIIPNPIKDGLPKIYTGKRKQNIMTFCRISKEKNLDMLIEAFAIFNKEYPQYKLCIIGDALNKEGEIIKKKLQDRIKELELEDCVFMLPFMSNVHEAVYDDSMYINTSNYEGMCNAMLEAMAMGMPVICTDCPIGGASAMIQDGINGLLVPVNDIKSLYIAMRRIVENEELAKMLSQNAVKIRETLSLENISKKWMELV